MSDTLDLLRDLGSAITPNLVEKSMALFAPLLPQVNEAEVVRDISYGEHSRHRLDLFGSLQDLSDVRSPFTFTAAASWGGVTREQPALRSIIISVHGPLAQAFSALSLRIALRPK